MAPKKVTRVSPSKRGEGSKPKPVAKKVSPSKRGEGSTNAKGIVAMKKKTAKVQESGVGNLPMTVAKGVVALGKKISNKKPAPTPAKSKPKSNVKVVTNRTELTSTKNYNDAIRAKIKEQTDIIKNAAREDTRKKAIQTARQLKSQLKK